MADKTGIEWTDATWNPVSGCSKVSQGCKHCYAERDWGRLVHLPAYQGRTFTDVACHRERLEQPLRWKRPRKVFVNSMSDLFHPDVPDEFIDRVFAVMAIADQHVFQVLTKRPERMQRYLSTLQSRAHEIAQASMAVLNGRYWTDSDSMWDFVVNRIDAGPLPNVWIGVSVEDQKAADERIPLLMQTPAAVRWISAEPLLGAVNLNLAECLNGCGWVTPIECNNGKDLACPHCKSVVTRCGSGNRPGGLLGKRQLDWVVVGGESGPNARPMSPDWARGLRDQCAAAGVPFLFKQWGEWLPDSQNPEMSPPYDLGGAIRVGKKVAGRLLDGQCHDGYPALIPLLLVW